MPEAPAKAGQVPHSTRYQRLDRFIWCDRGTGAKALSHRRFGVVKGRATGGFRWVAWVAQVAVEGLVMAVVLSAGSECVLGQSHMALPLSVPASPRRRGGLALPYAIARTNTQNDSCSPGFNRRLRNPRNPPENPRLRGFWRHRSGDAKALLRQFRDHTI